MKKIIMLLAVTALITSCKDKSLSYEEPSSVPVFLIGNTAAGKTEKEKVVYVVPQQTEKVVYTTSSTNTAQKKKGMSKAAKGAIIGGTTGAVTGAIISKSGKGAIIGGVLGVGTGYIIGRKKDKKDGRVD